MNYGQKIDQMTAELAILVTTLNLLRRHTEAGAVQSAVQSLSAVSREGTLRNAPWPGPLDAYLPHGDEPGANIAEDVA